MRTLADLSASKLHPAEQQTIRDAADGLLFCRNLSTDAGARDALDALEQLATSLVESDRMLPETAGRLIADVQACGPLLPVL